MARIVVSTQVPNTGPEPIRAHMCEPHHHREIADPTEGMIGVPSREFGVGYIYKEHGGITTFIGEAEWRVTDFEPKRHQVHIGVDASMTMHLEIELTPADVGTRLTQALILKVLVYRCGQRDPMGASGAKKAWKKRSGKSSGSPSHLDERRPPSTRRPRHSGAATPHSSHLTWNYNVHPVRCAGSSVGGLPGSVHVGTVVNVDNSYRVVMLVDLVDDAIGADPRGVETGQVATELLAHAMWVLE